MNNAKLNVIDAMRFLWQFAKKHKVNFFLFYLGWLVVTFLKSITPLLIALMIDEVVYYKNMTFFLRISLVFIAVSIFTCILFFLLYTIHHYLINMYTFDIRSKLFKKLVNSRASFLSDINTGDIITVLFRDADESLHIIVRNLFHFVNGVLRLILYIVFITLHSWKMGALMVLAVPLSFVVVRHYGKQTRIKSEKYREIYGSYISWVYEMLRGLREIRLQSANFISSKNQIKYLKKIISIKIEKSIINLKVRQAVAFIGLIIDMSIYILAGFLAYRGEITVGIFIAALEYFRLSKEQVKFISENNLDMHNRLANIQRVYDTLQIETEKNTWSGNKQISIKKGEISYKNISFSYKDSNTVLKNINLDINSGEHIAVVGLSGTGKTTFINLLLGFYKPNTGSISIDGINIEQCSLKSLRKNIGVVQQDIFIFPGTIRENLSFGNHKAGDKEMLTACEKAAVGDLIRSLPDGLDTVVGKGNIDLSGGQKQRLVIARIYLKNPKILIFDEATSSLDHKSEKKVHQAWEELSRNKTTIIISHRLSSIIHSDRVVVLNDGQIVSCGHHDILVKNCSYYNSLFKRHYLGAEA